MNQIANYTVASVKKIRGHDGYGYSCNLMHNGKKVAEILEDGWGGGLQFRWLDKVQATVHTLNYKDENHSFEGTAEESLFYGEVMKLPKIDSFDGKKMNTSADIVIDDMVNDSLAVKKITADLKKNLTIQAKDGALLTWKISATHSMASLKIHALKKHPEAKIINDLPMEQVFNIYKQANLIS